MTSKIVKFGVKNVGTYQSEKPGKPLAHSTGMGTKTKSRNVIVTIHTHTHTNNAHYCGYN